MNPKADNRKLYRVCDRRLQAADLLLEHGFYLEAVYIAGYAVECALKALILKRTPFGDYPSTWKNLTAVGAMGMILNIFDIYSSRRIVPSLRTFTKPPVWLRTGQRICAMRSSASDIIKQSNSLELPDKSKSGASRAEMNDSKSRKKLRTQETREVERWLKDNFKGWSAKYPPTAYRYNSASIRVRLVSSRFKGKSFGEREEMVQPLIRELPEETQAEIMMLALLPPEELDRSPLNYEFEHPSPHPE